jgi:hypothetical protein
MRGFQEAKATSLHPPRVTHKLDSFLQLRSIAEKISVGFRAISNIAGEPNGSIDGPAATRPNLRRSSLLRRGIVDQNVIQLAKQLLESGFTDFSDRDKRRQSP